MAIYPAINIGHDMAIYPAMPLDNFLAPKPCLLSFSNCETDFGKCFPSEVGGVTNFCDLVIIIK